MLFRSVARPEAEIVISTQSRSGQVQVTEVSQTGNSSTRTTDESLNLNSAAVVLPPAITEVVAKQPLPPAEERDVRNPEYKVDAVFVSAQTEVVEREQVPPGFQRSAGGDDLWRDLDRFKQLDDDLSRRKEHVGLREKLSGDVEKSEAATGQRLEAEIEQRIGDDGGAGHLRLGDARGVAWRCSVQQLVAENVAVYVKNRLTSDVQRWRGCVCGLTHDRRRLPELSAGRQDSYSDWTRGAAFATVQQCQFAFESWYVQFLQFFLVRCYFWKMFALLY